MKPDKGKLGIITYGHGGATEGKIGHEHAYSWNPNSDTWELIACWGIARHGRCAASCEPLPEGTAFDRQESMKGERDASTR